MDKQNPPRRWAKVLVVDGVMACIQHVWDDDNEGYAITCTIQSSGAQFSTSIGRDEPFPQEVFDQVGDDLVRKAIATARGFGFEPMTVADGCAFSCMLKGTRIDSGCINHQVYELDLLLNGKPTPGVTLGLLLNNIRAQARAGAFVQLADVRNGMERAAMLCEERSAGWNPDDPALDKEDACRASGAQYEGRALAYTIREAARSLAPLASAPVAVVGGASHG